MPDTVTQRPPSLQRPRDDRVIAGVASGLAHRLGIGTGWVRVGFVFLSFFGGLGVLLYLVGWLAIREEGEPSAIAESWIGDLEGSTAWIGVGLVILAGMVLLSATSIVRVELVLAAGLFLAGILLYRGHLGPGEAPPRPTQDSAVARAAAAEVAATTEGAVAVAAASDGVSSQLTEETPPDPLPAVSVRDGAALPVAPAASPRTRRAPSYLGRIVLASGLIVIGAVALLDNLDVIDPGARHYVAAGMLVLGLGLLVGTVVGRARGLVALGLLLTPVLLLTAAVQVPFGGEWGDRRFEPADASELQSQYELSGGQLNIDLRQLTAVAPGTPVMGDLGIGEMIVWLPPGMDIELRADVGIGALEVFGAESGGFGVDDELMVTNGDGEIDLVLDLEVGIGALRIVGSE